MGGMDKVQQIREKLIMGNIKERSECFARRRKNNRKYGMDAERNFAEPFGTLSERTEWRRIGNG